MSLSSILRDKVISTGNLERRIDPSALSGAVVGTDKVLASVGSSPWGLALNNMSSLEYQALVKDAVNKRDPAACGISVVTHDVDYVNPKVVEGIAGGITGKFAANKDGVAINGECILTGKSAPILVAYTVVAAADGPKDATSSGMATSADASRSSDVSGGFSNQPESLSRIGAKKLANPDGSTKEATAPVAMGFGGNGQRISKGVTEIVPSVVSSQSMVYKP
jgi:hypothetical protein